MDVGVSVGEWIVQWGEEIDFSLVSRVQLGLMPQLACIQSPSPCQRIPHVVITGQKHILWYQISRLCFVSTVEIWTLLEDVSGCWDDCWGDGLSNREKK